MMFCSLCVAFQQQKVIKDMDLSKVKRYLVTSLTNQYIFLIKTAKIKTSHINIENFLILRHVFKVKMCMFLVKLAGSEKGNCS
jgi:hypothetical protein